jgi:hypothetical protein
MHLPGTAAAVRRNSNRTSAGRLHPSSAQHTEQLVGDEWLAPHRGPGWAAARG